MVPRDAEVRVDLPVDGVESEKVRWYLEDYAEYPAEPAPRSARDAELSGVGRAGAVRAGLRRRGAARGVGEGEAAWAGRGAGGDRHRPGRRAGRAVGAAAGSGLPTRRWRSRRRSSSGPITRPPAGATARADGEPLRVLLVICRPGGRGGRAVPVGGLPAGARRRGPADGAGSAGAAAADVRPAWRGAAGGGAAGRPFHIVHFDGHGAYLDAAELAD